MQRPLLLAVTLVWSLLTFDLGKVEAVRVETPLGSVEGVVTDNSDNFLGIKFATAERFAQPVAVSPWTGVYNASKVGPMCSQYCPPIPPKICQPEMSEDCLYLNVFRPKRKSSSSLPVMLFMHGGGFTTYSGGSPLYRGDNFVAAADVILVTINYRLGAFGWLGFVNAAGEVTDGNFGLSDQRLALEWVRDNIASLGGNPNKVTLFGQSAGCQSTGLHLVSPKSQGLFHRAILHSCPPVLPFRTASEAKKQNALLSRALNCSEGDVTCLKSVTSEELIDVTENLTSSFSQELLMKFQIWGPVVDGDDVTDRYLIDALNGTKVSVPVILGTMENEGTIFVRSSTFPHLSKMMYSMLLELLWPDLSANITRLYPVQGNDVISTLRSLATDAIFYCPVTAIGKSISEAGERVWQYHFNQPMSIDGFKDPKGICLGKACHGGDLPFLFDSPPLDGVNVTWDDQLLSKLMIGYWGEFARHGNPDGDVVGMTTWPDLSVKDEEGKRRHFLFRSGKFTTIPEPKRDDCSVLDGIWKTNG